jgi:hypothetical protein
MTNGSTLNAAHPRSLSRRRERAPPDRNGMRSWARPRRPRRSRSPRRRRTHRWRARAARRRPDTRPPRPDAFPNTATALSINEKGTNTSQKVTSAAEGAQSLARGSDICHGDVGRGSFSRSKRFALSMAVKATRFVNSRSSRGVRRVAFVVASSKLYQRCGSAIERDWPSS